MSTKTQEKIGDIFDQLTRRNKDLEQIILSETQLSQNMDADESSVKPIPVHYIPINLPLSCPVYIKKGNKFIMSCRQGDKISNKQVVALQKQNVSEVYIHNIFWNYFQKSLKEMNLAKEPSSQKSAKPIQELFITYGKELQKKAKQSKVPVFKNIENESYALASQLFKTDEIDLSLTRRSSDSSSYFLNHSINVAIISAFLGKKVGLPIQAVKLLTFAGIIHNIGNIYIPKKVLFKKSSLKRDEWEIIHTHPSKGAELLQSAGCPPIIASIAFQHHERINGTGYPKKLKENDIHLLSKIIAIADVFDAICSERPFRQAQTPTEAIEQMKKEKEFFDPRFLSTLAESL